MYTLYFLRQIGLFVSLFSLAEAACGMLIRAAQTPHTVNIQTATYFTVTISYFFPNLINNDIK